MVGGVRGRGAGVCGRGHDMHAPLWTEFCRILTNTCENITFPQLLLRAVKIIFWRVRVYSPQTKTKGISKGSLFLSHGVNGPLTTSFLKYNNFAGTIHLLTKCNL